MKVLIVGAGMQGQVLTWNLGPESKSVRRCRKFTHGCRIP